MIKHEQEYNLNTLEVKAGGPELQSCLWLHNKLQPEKRETLLKHMHKEVRDAF